MTEPLWTNADWSFQHIQRVWEEVEKIAVNELHLNLYQNQFEVISSEQMLDAYASIGMPIFYQHWSFGKQFMRESDSYRSGRSGLAYELVINSSPCINYLMEDNSMTMQALVIAHAGAGHNHFFKNNYCFKQWTDAESIVDYLIFAKDYITTQEEKHGRKEVEAWLDSCHAFMNYGINRYKRPSKISMEKEKVRQTERAAHIQSQVSELYRILPKEKDDRAKNDEAKNKFPTQPEENLLYFFEKYSPYLEDWQREILRIVRKMAVYFYPQMQTKVMNEGFASMTHYTILNMLHDRGLTTDGAHLEFLSSHSGVLFQPDYDSKYYSGINPYALGFAMLRDIKRMCDNPTAEDLRWFPQIKGADAQDIILESVENFRDESFIRQWLSPSVIRQFHLFNVQDDRSDKEKYLVTAIHNEKGYDEVRERLADFYLETSMVPQLEVTNVDRKTRQLTLTYTEYKGRKLDNIDKMFPHLEKLWGGFPVVIIDQNYNVLKKTY